MLTSSTSHAVLNNSPSRLLHSRVSLPIASWCCMSVVLVSGAVPAAGKQNLKLTNSSCSRGLNAHSASSDISLAAHQQQANVRPRCYSLILASVSMTSMAYTPCRSVSPGSPDPKQWQLLCEVYRTGPGSVTRQAAACVP